MLAVRSTKPSQQPAVPTLPLSHAAFHSYKFARLLKLYFKPITYCLFVLLLLRFLLGHNYPIQSQCLRLLFSRLPCPAKAVRVLGKMEGVESYDINLEEQKVTVSGKVQPEAVLQTVSKTGKKTSFWEEAAAAVAETKPVEAETQATEAETKPEDAETKPADAETKPEDAAAAP